MKFAVIGKDYQKGWIMVLKSFVFTFFFLLKTVKGLI